MGSTWPCEENGEETIQVFNLWEELFASKKSVAS